MEKCDNVNRDNGSYVTLDEARPVILSKVDPHWSSQIRWL